MFTGLVEEIGFIHSLQRQGDGYLVGIQASLVVNDLHTGDSVAVNGVCLTVTACNEKSFIVQAVGETVLRSTMSGWTVNMPVNLERALPAQGRLGGHFVQGHVDGVAEVVSFTNTAAGFWLLLHMPDELNKFLVSKGSLAVNGVSLTIAEIKNNKVAIAVIPHTAAQTTLKQLKSGDMVNIETDIIGKYIYKLMQPYSAQDNLTMDKLGGYGFE
ncbi:MAG TPA: riboflavin synthase [bacterium]|nr:riboflavin synthase [bacterium]HPN42400.1 riboflavin synthase [bacterium]